MARPQRNGLAYFPFDVDFFSDRKIKHIRTKYGNDGVMVYVYILCEIYRDHGYYVDYDEDLILDISGELGISENYTKQVVNYLLSRSLFNDKLAGSVKVLTAASIQRRYQEAVSTRGQHRNVFVDERLWLLKKEETKGFIKVYLDGRFSENNDSFSKKNPNKSEKSDTKESKVKESKVKESKAEESSSADADSAAVIELYNSICVSYPRIVHRSDELEERIASAVNEGFGVDDFKQVFEKAQSSSFLKGKGGKGWSADFEWLVNPKNMVKVLNGKYDERSSDKYTISGGADPEDYESLANYFGGTNEN